METISFTVENIDYIIFIGKNKYSNYNLIDASKDTDIWFHISGSPSCHVILKNEGNLRDIPKQVIKRCAYLCKINSTKAKILANCEVIYALIDDIEKTNIVGQVNVHKSKSVGV